MDKINWEIPVLIDLGRRKRAHGACGGGSGDYECNPSGSAASFCFTVGSTAAAECSLGNSN